MLKLPFLYSGQEPAPTDVYRGSYHPGVDWPLRNKTAIIAVTSGEVAMLNSVETRQWVANTDTDPFLSVVQKAKLKMGFIGRGLTTNDYGRFVKLYHGKDAKGRKIYTLCAHLDSVEVRLGELVKEGQLIGYSDSTGNSTGNHLHFEIRVDDKCVDPFEFDLGFEGKGGENKPYFVFDTTVDIPAGVVLNVRLTPSVAGNIVNTLHGGDKVKVLGYVKGEEVDGNPWWYNSIYGRYFWAGGTNQKVPAPKQKEDIILTVVEKDRKENNMEPVSMTALEEKRNALTVEIIAKRGELAEVEKEIEELKRVPEEEAVEDVVEPTNVEAPVVAPVVDEEVETVNTVSPEPETVVEEDPKAKAAKLLESLAKMLGL